jgi:glycosyltransferase involved in cell wall biosynthesis
MSKRNEGLSNAVLEYMALGKPVIATNCAGNRELVADGETGLLVPRGASDALATRIVELLDNPTWAREMGIAARQRVERDFSMERMIQEYKDLYAEILAGD